MTKHNVRYTIADGFELLSKKIELPLSKYMLIARQQADIERYLGQFIQSFSTELPGAFFRKTITSPVSGITTDMYVLFKEEASKRFKPSQLLDKLFITLKERYPETVQSNTLMAVIVPVGDFQFKIQPGFLTSDHQYLVPAPSFDYWLEYDASAYRSSLLQADTAHKGNLIPAIRMIKTWNRLSGNMFDGYYLELMATEVLATYEINHYAEAIHHIFRRAVAQVVFKINDPANPEILIEGLLHIEDLVKSMLHIKNAYQITTEALEHERNGDNKSALKCWQKLFPDYFPTDIDLVIGQLRKQGIEGKEALKIMMETI